MNTKAFLLAALAFFIGDPLSAAQPRTPVSALPNLVLFIADDMGWNEVGYHGSKISTPHIDRLAKDGLQLDRFYVHPVCSPTRTALMTGRSPARFGITAALTRGAGVPPGEHFMPQTFQKAGYQTYLIGKWHLGASDLDARPNARGFDHFFGFHGGGIDYYPQGGLRARGWYRNVQPVIVEGYSTDILAAEAIRLIKNRDRRRPIFLNLSFNAPHPVAQASAVLIEKYAKLGFTGRMTAHAGAIDAMDQAIGRVLAAIETEGMARNTLVMFFCDNGSGGGGRGLRGSGPKGGAGQLALRGGKGSVLEGGIRVPAVLRWPGVIPVGAKSGQLISDVDLFPTLTVAMGIPPKNLKPFDGVNVWDALRKNKIAKRKPVVVAGSRGEFALLRDRWKLILSPQQTSLYDVIQDPTESRDVILDHPIIAAELAEALLPIKAPEKKRNAQ
jgi:arylsulfatase A-like enzyme